MRILASGKRQHGGLEDVTRICERCGIPYEPLESNQKYCSITCRNQPYYALQLDHICPHCGSHFTASRKKKYCSRECSREARLKIKGWGIKKEKWLNLREYIIERDNFSCKDCGKFAFDQGLDVHHIKPLYKGGNNYSTNLITLCDKCHMKRHKNR